MADSTSSKQVLRLVQAVFFVGVILYVGKILFIPLFFGLFIAIVLYPIITKLEQHRVPRPFAIAIGISIVTIVFLLLTWLLLIQIDYLRQDWPDLKNKIQPALESIQRRLQATFNLPDNNGEYWWQKMVTDISNNPGTLIQNLYQKTTSSLFIVFITPVFAALFLYRRQDFVLFLRTIVAEKYRQRVGEIVQEVVVSYSRFIKGMVIVYLAVGALNSLGLWALGIRYALLFGFLAAIMTIIPYIGIIVSALLPISVAWLTKGSILYPLGVVVVFGFVQYLEANVIFPRVVGKQLDVSTWAILITTIAGGILWGVSGMVLFIPFAGILKIVADHVPEWEALRVILSRNPSAHKKSPS